MRKLTLLLALVCSIGTVLALPATADDNKTVNAMVTPKIIALTVSSASLQYSSRGVGTSDNIPTPVKITVTNTGTVSEDFQIRAGASTPGGWTPVTGSPGANEYRHRIDNSSGGSFSGALTTTNQGFANSVAVAGTAEVFFKLDMPTSTTSFAEQTLPIVITALED